MIRLLLVDDHPVVRAGYLHLLEQDGDMRVVAQSDWVIDIGPGAGEAGGKVVVAGTPQTVAKSKKSRTASFLASTLQIP